MKKWFLHILLLAGLFGMLTTSCSQESEGLEPNMPSINTQVMFNITMGAPSTVSRATIYTSEGNLFENQIDPDMLFVKLVLDGEICTVSKISCFETDATNVYTVVGEINATSTTFEEAKIIVCANVSNSRETFNVDYEEYPSKGVKCIPMWGVKTIKNFSLTPGGIKDFGRIDLLRAMAKIEVVLGSEVIAGKYTISEAGLGKYNTVGYWAPNNSGDYETTSDFYTQNENHCYPAGYMNVAVSSGTLGLPFEVASDNKSCIIYVPEYDYVDEGDDVKIHLLFNKSESESVQLESFGVFSLKDQDLVRNHWYKYTINRINEGAELDVTCQVQPWELQQQVIDYTSEPAAAEGGKIRWIGATPDASNQVALNSNLEAQCTFTLNSPLGYQWVASLVPVGDGASAANSPFRFVTNNQVAGMDTSGIIDGKPVTLTIKSTATDGVDEDKVVRLQIIVIKGDGTSVILDEDVIGGPYTVIHTK